MPARASTPMVRHPDLVERIAPFAAPAETVVGAFRVFRGPRPGTEFLAIALNVPVFAFAPIGALASVVICLISVVAITVMIQILRQYILCAVTDRGVLLIGCGHVPGRWSPKSLIASGPWASMGTVKDRVESRIRIGDRSYWLRSAEYDEARRLSAWIADQT